MKNTFAILLLGLFSLLLMESCQQSSASSSNNAEEPEINTPTERPEMLAVLYQQTAAEYRALCYQAFNVAKFQLNILAGQNRSGKKLSVIVDIDETMLDNSPYEARSILDDLSYPEGWEEWIKSESAEAVPGALEFVRYAQTIGVEVFYVSNRNEKYLNETLKNLNKLEFPFAKGDHIFLKRDESSKKSRREQITRQTEVVMLIGDNLADFSEVFENGSMDQRAEITDRFMDKFGSRFIVIPNAIYGDWVSAIYKNDKALTPEQKFTLRKESLKSY